MSDKYDSTGYPRHRENRENRKNCPKISCHGKNREFGNFSKHRENTGNFFCLSGKCFDSKSKGHCDIYSKKDNFFPRSWIGLPSQFCVCDSHKLCKLAQGKFAVTLGKQGI